MANNKYAGYTPDPKKEELVQGGQSNRLDRVNPYEFKKGMDYELTAVGVTRLAESTVEQREAATEKVLSNLKEHGAYYSALIQFEGGMNHGAKITETNFKKFLENYTSGDGMIKVSKETTKMEEPKYDKAEYTKPFKTDLLKEAIKKEIKNILSETLAKDAKKINKDDAKKAASDKKDLKKHLKGKKGIDKQIQKLEDERKQKEEKRSEFFSVYKNSKKDTKATQKYKDKVLPLQDRIKEIDKEIKELETQLIGLAKEEKMMRREAAGMMMDKRIHLEILEIIKEAGVNLREGAGGVKMYYEIAKTAYMEGLTAGLNKE
tara:strand:- start:108 stop:1064 length:957 start_codon:yes stop_codon:yes gene_type:complete